MIPEREKPEAVIEVNQFQNKKIAEENITKCLNVKSLFNDSMTTLIKLNKKAVKTGYNNLTDKDKKELDLMNELMNNIINLMKEFSEKMNEE